MLQDHGLDSSVTNIAVIVECCEFVSTASFSWSILYTRAAYGTRFARMVSLSQDSSKINLRRSQFAALSRSWFTRVRCASVRVSSPLKVFAQAGAFTLSTHTCSRGAPSVGLEGPDLLSSCLGGICSFGLGCCCLFFLACGSLAPCPGISICSPWQRVVV